jgi:Na+/proline symporter
LVIAVTNYLLAQLMAMGHVVAGLSDGTIPYWMGVVLLGLVIIIYETLGGLRAVAWTDCAQALLLLVGLTGLLIAAAPGPSALADVTNWIVANQPEKAVVPPWTLQTTWVSTILLIGFSGAVYPQAIQRIYAARSVRVLRRSLSAMIFMPLFTTMPVFFVGILSIRHFSSLGGVAADQVMPMMLREWADQSMWMYVMVLFVVTGIVAAIMSTADSVLLSLSSMLAKDFAGKHFWKGADEPTLTRLGKVISWILMGVMMVVALSPRITLWGLIELKMEILVQVSPAFLLGLTWRRVGARAVLTGMAVGTALGAGLTLAGYGRIAGIHAGLIGWAVNLGLTTALTLAPGFGVRSEPAAALNRAMD